MNPFPARYAGRCAACDERIHEGDSIFMTDEGALHYDCEALTPRPEHPEVVCTQCWLTSCDCGKETK